MLLTTTLTLLFRILIFCVGAWIVIGTSLSALRTFVLPRSAPDVINRSVFIIVGYFFHLRIHDDTSYERKDRILELYAPVALIVLLITWLVFIQIGYTGLLWAVDDQTWYSAFVTSGSSLLTLGFRIVDNLPSSILIFSEATIGLILIALLIAYLPTIYGAFARREAAVTQLEIRAGSPASAVTMIKRFSVLERLDKLGDVWNIWEGWFIDVGESHTSLAALAYFRSPQPHRSWIAASGVVLDGASLTLACVDIPRNAQADLCIRAGYLALRYIATFFNIKYDSDPAPTDPISITRAEFDEAWREMAEAGVPLKADQDQAWRDFAGWRVNYDRVLVALATLTTTPYVPWVSDRVLPDTRTGSLRWRHKPARHQQYPWVAPIIKDTATDWGQEAEEGSIETIEG